MGSPRIIVARSAGVVVWAFVLWSVYLVTRYGIATFFDPTTTCRIMAVSTGERMHSAIGLTYHGVGGAVLVAVEVIGVLAAMVLTRSRVTPVRRGALLVVLAWAALWLANALWLGEIAGWRHPVRITFVAVATLAAAVMMVLRWRRPVIERAAG